MRSRRALKGSAKTKGHGVNVLADMEGFLGFCIRKEQFDRERVYLQQLKMVENGRREYTLITREGSSKFFPFAHLLAQVREVKFLVSFQAFHLLYEEQN